MRWTLRRSSRCRARNPSSAAPRIWLVALSVNVAFPGQLWAHQGLHELIAAKTAEIAGRPADPRLHLERADLHRLHAEWGAAFTDVERAEELEPRAAEAMLTRARILSSLGWQAAAEVAVVRFLKVQPNDPGGLELLATTLQARGRTLPAAEAYSCLIELAGAPRPEWYIHRARLLAAAGGVHLAEAIRGLDEGMNRLGQPVVTLQLAAIDLEIERQNHDAALERLQTLIAQSARPERWLVWRGQILAKAGRHSEAETAYRQALEAIAALSPARRQTRIVQELENEARSALTQAAPVRTGTPPSR